MTNPEEPPLVPRAEYMKQPHLCLTAKSGKWEIRELDIPTGTITPNGSRPLDPAGSQYDAIKIVQLDGEGRLPFELKLTAKRIFAGDFGTPVITIFNSSDAPVTLRQIVGTQSDGHRTIPIEDYIAIAGLDNTPMQFEVTAHAQMGGEA